MTKGELANRILKAIGVNTRTSEASPQEVSDVLEMVQDWMLAQNAIGKRLGYVVSESPDPNEEAGIPDWSVLGVVYSVAEQACTYYEKQYTPSMARLASKGMKTIVNRTVEVQDVQYPSRFPRGTGNAHPYGPRYYHPDNRIVTSNDYLTDEGDDPVTTTP